METEKISKRPRIKVVRSDANYGSQRSERPNYSSEKSEDSSNYSGYRSNTFNSERSLGSTRSYNDSHSDSGSRPYRPYDGNSTRTPNRNSPPRPSTNRSSNDGERNGNEIDRPADGFASPMKGQGTERGGVDGYSRQQPRGNGRLVNNKKIIKKGPRPQQVEYQDTFIDPEKPLRLNKYLANAGVCSRRDADVRIKNGDVKVNGEVVTELGAKVFRDDFITIDNKAISMEKKVYVLLNKPKNCVTTSDDPEERKTVLDLVKSACRERIYPVGRLDRNTTGVLLLTNDGDLASKLTHPKYDKKKIYHVWLDKDVPMEDLEKIAEGIELEDGLIHADAISYAAEDDMTQIGIEIHSGRNRIVRRIFEHLGYKVYKLDRVLFAGLTKKNLPRGRWRYLTQDEVNMLRMGAFE